MGETEDMVAKSLFNTDTNKALIKSNNVGKGVARAVESKLKNKYSSNHTVIKWFHQSENKVARILSNATWVMEHIYFPVNWRDRLSDYYHAMITYQREGKNLNNDATDATS